MLGLTRPRPQPEVVIRAILRMQVDLLWNGGIGTYVKASWETHADADDRSNDALRVNANELRCKVVGEGGNLGFTQAPGSRPSLLGSASTPTPSTTRAASTCPTTRSTSRSCSSRVVAAGR
jgi:glutamate dehydrogenase